MSRFKCPFCDHSVLSTGSAMADAEADYLISVHLGEYHPEKTEEEIAEAMLPTEEEIAEAEAALQRQDERDRRMGIRPR